jgi:hypothetical protein
MSFWEFSYIRRYVESTDPWPGEAPSGTLGDETRESGTMQPAKKTRIMRQVGNTIRVFAVILIVYSLADGTK